VNVNISTSTIGTPTSFKSAVFSIHHNNDSLWAVVPTTGNAQLRSVDIARGNSSLLADLGTAKVTSVASVNSRHGQLFQILDDYKTLLIVSGTQVRHVTLTNAHKIVHIVYDDRSSSLYAVDMARTNTAYTVGHINLSNGQYVSSLPYVPQGSSVLYGAAFSHRDHLYTIAFEKALLVVDVSARKIVTAVAIPGFNAQNVVGMVYASNFAE